ncbi:histidinol-phosphate phosphatase HisN [Aeromicrobium marinum DSM 15272]|uniref:Histidinol-phosphatase n=1 Tax=Aeromicrobium marinum DSM 15272 TaxID=585531 RepID=E2SCK9_9ACTN|nr:histidinol-phosphatase [Aeromicrobium marinum]EFQ82962.1 histidinol-phosphate phosphatase HisN [Aeromicrobium marinum DSM 15272]
MAHSYADDLRLAHVLADSADNLSMDRFGAIDLEVSTKPDLSWVTESDQAVEESIRRTLRSARTRDAVFGEEMGAHEGSTGSAERRWIIDPIDGTSNFVRGVPVWATLIALEEAGEIVAGLVSAPALGRRWWAHKGSGAYTGKSVMNAREIRVSRVSDLENASFSFSSTESWEDIGKAEAFTALTRRCWRTRAYGDFWSYMLLAEGAVDIAAEPELKLWDMAALDVIVREAGGRFTSLAGDDGPWGANALATNGRLHDAAMAYLGHFPDDGPHDETWADEPEAADLPATPRNNVRSLDFGRPDAFDQ